MDNVKKLIEAAIVNGEVVEWKKGLPTGTFFQNHRGCYGYVMEYDKAGCVCTSCGTIHYRHRGDWKETYACPSCKGSGSSPSRSEVKSSLPMEQETEAQRFLREILQEEARAALQKKKDMADLAALRQVKKMGRALPESLTLRLEQLEEVYGQE